MSPIITLTTDFGLTGHYVAQMKGAILSINPAAQLIDITHAIGPQNVRQGAVAMRDATVMFPTGSVHVGVVDPGVGTARKIVYAEIDGRHYIAPDNGLLGLVQRGATNVTRIIAVENRKYWREVVSTTFHGRDIMAPVAAHVSLGVDPTDLGKTLTAMQTLDWPEPLVTPSAAQGEIVEIDHFGNAITNLRQEHLPGATPQHWGQVEILAGSSLRISGLSATYGERASGAGAALIGSGGYLEIAVVGGSAAERFSLQVGDAVTVCWSAKASPTPR
jgi:S-adenosylmethionine hydrolase